MDGVRLLPESIRGEGQNSKKETDSVIGLSGLEERTVSGIVLDNDQPHQETGSWDCQKQGQPVGIVEAAQHGEPQKHKRYKGIPELKDTSSNVRLTVTSQ